MFQEFEPSNRQRITAVEAREIAEKNIGLEIKVSLDAVDAKIEEATKKNDFACTIYFSIPPMAIENLQKRGFNVQDESFAGHSADNEPQFRISW